MSRQAAGERPAAARADSDSEADLRRVAGEVCHRAKNDFQTIANLLALASPYVSTPQALAEAMEGRVGALSVCYSLISEQSGPPTLDRLVEEVLRRLLWRQSLPARVERQVEPVQLSLRLCSSLSLWLHEITDNALVHGLAKASQPRLKVSAGLDQQGLTLSISDNGPGLPEGFALPRDAHLGLRLAQAVATSDLRGRLELKPGVRGLTASLFIPAKEIANLNRDSWL